MVSNRYIIADRVVEIHSLYDEVHTYCAGYQTDETAEYSVTVSQEDIAFEREKSACEDKLQGIPARHFPDSYLEKLAVYRKIAEQMTAFDTILFHGSCIAVDGMGYLFTAKSGTGKSTHTQLWREYFGDRAVMVNDDKPLIHIGANDVTVYGTPYNGKHRLGNNLAVPLKAICILTRADENHIEPLSAQQAYPMLVQQVYRSADRVKMMKTLRLIDTLTGQVSFYRLGCNMNLSAAKVAFEGMQ